MSAASSNRFPFAPDLRDQRAFILSCAALLAALLALPGPGNTSAAQESAGNVEYAAKLPLAPRSLLLDGQALGERTVAVGERGHILISTDAGNSWSQATVPTRVTLTGVHFHDEKLGWAVGHDAVILRTTDGGESWKRMHYAPEEGRALLDVWFRDAEHGFAIGAYGYFLRTSDGGRTWAEDLINPGHDFHLNDIAVSQSGRLYISAEAGFLYRSDDGGENWQTLDPPYEGSFFGSVPLRGETLLLFGLRGHLFRSEDAGESWEQIRTGTEAMLTDGLRLRGGRVVLVGHAGAVLVSDDGRRFALHAQADRKANAAAVELNAGPLLLIGENGTRLVNPSEYTSPKRRAASKP